MMDIVMLVAGAGIGAMLRDLFVLHRGDKNKNRQQLGSKSPYDYALTNARSDNERLREELTTLRALKRTETDNERLRNEIETIAHEDGEEATEDVYERNIGMPIRDNGDGTFSPITWDSQIPVEERAERAIKEFAKAFGTHVREDEDPILYRVKSGDTLYKIAREHGTTIANIEKVNGKGSLRTYSVGDVIKLPKEVGQSADRGVERSLINGIVDKASENLELAVEFAKMTVQDDEAIRKQLEESLEEIAEETRELRRGIREFKEEGKYYGETLYGKGNL